MPKQVAAFLLETPLNSLNRHEFIKFYSSPALVEHTRNKGVSGKIRDTSYYIASFYSKLGEMDKAGALTLNGAFIMDSMSGTFNTFDLTFDIMINNPPKVLHRWIEKMLETGDASLKQVTDNIGEIGNEIGYLRKNRKKPSSKSEGTEIQLILVDGANAEERHILTIGSSTTLKTLFNDYADKRGVSLRSLRFSYNGKTLFLSCIRNKTPDELYMGDKDVISVCNTHINVSGGSGTSNPAKKNKSTPKHPKKHYNRTKKTRCKRKKTQNKQAYAIKSVEEYKAHHSKILSKLHEEVEHQLKEIRMRLNSLDLERQPPKNKRKNYRKKTKVNIERQTILPKSGVGGKAGKSCFVVQVGEIQNLYNTTKSSQRNSSGHASTLDLHGCTKGEAIAKLDESLKIWVDAAMRGCTHL